MPTQKPPEEPNDQVKKDIEDILRQMGDEDDSSSDNERREPLRVAVPREPRIAKPRGRGRQPVVYMGLGALLLVIGLVIPNLRVAFVIGGILLLGYGYWQSWKSSRPSGTRSRRTTRSEGANVRYWRGQRIEYGATGEDEDRGNIVQFRETWVSRLKRWWRNR